MRPTRLFPLLLLACLVAACTEAGESGLTDVERDAENAWAALQEHPDRDHFLEFQLMNGYAASRHEETHDRTAVRYKVRAIEAQGEYAARDGDLDVALQVVDRYRELEQDEMIPLFEEVFPGARRRMEAAYALAVQVVADAERAAAEQELDEKR